MRVLAKSLLLLILLFAVPALAQVEPPARVGRVSLVSGALAFYGPGDSDWSAAKVNLPVAADAWLATDPQSRAELRIGADSLDLANDTQLNFAELRDRVMQIALPQGRVDLHLRRLQHDETAEIDVPVGGVWLLQQGVYDIDSGGPDQPTRVTVFEGSAHFVGGGIDTIVNAGDMLVLSGSGTLTAAVEHAAPDDFARWCRSHDYDEKRLAAPRHVSPAMTGYEELDEYGEWAAAPGYGEVWFPRSVPAGWAPYREGRWVWVEPWGWSWVDDEPWGFAPCHYGRWARLDDRWGWVPGELVPAPVYAPALVAFIPPPALAVPVPVPVDAGPPVGWFPLAPGEVYWPAYTRNPTYIRNVNITNVSITKINTIIAAAPAAGDPPPQVVHQQFANRAAATVVPARALVESKPVAAAAVAVPPQVLHQAAVAVTPPVLPRPAATAPTARASASTAASPAAGHAMPPASGVATAPIPPTPSTPAQAKPTGPAAARPPAKPNFSELAPAPRVSPMAETQRQSPTTPLGVQAPPGGTRPPSAAAPAPPASVNAAPPAPTPGHPPGAPDFSHLAPARVGPHGPPQSAQVAPGASPPTAPGAPPPAAPAAAGEPRKPVSETPATPAAAPTSPPTAVGRPPGPPDFSRLPAARHGPQPPASPAQATSASPEKPVATPEAIHQPVQAGPGPAATVPPAHAPPAAKAGVAQPSAPDHGAQERAAAEAAARQQAQQRAAAARQAQQRAAAEAAPRQQATATQQAQQRAAAEAAARQRAAAAQQRATAEAAARQQAAAAQQAQQRAAADAAARQQAQQHAAAGGAGRQGHAESCGHPGEPACPK